MERPIPTLTSDEADQLLNGGGFERDDLFELRDFLWTVAGTARSHPSVEAERQHLAAIADATRLEPLLAPAPRSRSNVMVRSILRTKTFRAVAGAAAAVLAMGGLAAAQTLPAPAQDAMAEVAERVGIDLPHSKDKVKRGADHDGDGVADDNGLHTGQTGEKRGADHDGDGVADDNGLHKGQSTDEGTGEDKTKRGNDHDGDGVADDNGLHRGEDKPDVEDRVKNENAGPKDEREPKVKDNVGDEKGRGRGPDGG